MRGKIENIQALRGVAALAVLFAHLNGAERDYGGEALITQPWFQIGVTGVDLFFLISGYVMTHVAANLARGPATSARFLFNRAARIYPLYWAVTITAIILYAGKKLLFAEDTPLGNVLASFLLMPAETDPILNVGWTLVHEMYFYFIFAGFILLAARYLPVFLLTWTGVIMAAVSAGWTSLNAWTEVVFSPLTFEFITGCIIALMIQRGAHRFAWPAIIAGVGVLVIMTAGFFEPLYKNAINNFGNRAIAFGPPYALILYGAVALESRGRGTAPQWLIKTGDISYSLYLVHIPVFLVVGKTLSLTGASGLWFNALLLIAYLIAAFSAAFAAHTWFEKPSLRYAKRLGDRLFKARSQTAVAPDKAW